MMRRIFCLGWMLLALVGTGMAAAPAASPELNGAIEQSRALCASGIAPKVPGYAVAVAVNGAIVWSEGFGFADLAAKVPVTTTTRFRVGSVSKPLTAVGLALLVEQGRLDLDAPVQKYLPEFPDKGAVITTRMLAGHLSGIRNYRGGEVLSNKPYPDLKSGLKIFADDPLEAPPGTKYGYSSYNWNLIGAVMERAAKQDFLAYMHDRVFQPLGMANTEADRAQAADPRRARFYEEDAAGKFVEAPPVDSSYKWPSGGFLSTAEDLARFGSALVQPGLLKPESRALLFTSQKTSTGKFTHYGVGWFVEPTVVYHGGDIIGGTAALLVLPQSHIVVAIACNRGHLTVGRFLGSSSLKNSPDHYSSALLVKKALAIADLFAPVASDKAF
jgi:CubicO group peptidase (beta-lactamase class C family)